MSLYKKLGGNSELETKGVWLDLGVVRIRLARAGGGNKAYLAKAAELQQKHGKAVELKLLSNERSVEIMQRLFAEEIVKGWEYPDPATEGAWLPGVEQPDGDVAECSAEAYFEAFKSLPNLWVECWNFANSLQYYNDAYISDAVGK